jgi:hypothetical protein
MNLLKLSSTTKPQHLGQEHADLRDRDREHGREEDRFDSKHLRDERQRIGRGGG